MTEKAAEKLESLRVEHDWTYGVLAKIGRAHV